MVNFLITGFVSYLKRKRNLWHQSIQVILNLILILQPVLQTNFLHPFSSLKPLKSGTHPKQRSISRGVILCWLGLLVNLTFFSDGQQGVVKTPGTVEALLDLSTTQAKQLQEKAILVLRNLCFHGASKPVLLVNGQYYWVESGISHFVYCWKSKFDCFPFRETPFSSRGLYQQHFYILESFMSVSLMCTGAQLSKGKLGFRY